jgi:DNA modification methylase
MRDPVAEYVVSVFERFNVPARLLPGKTLPVPDIELQRGSRTDGLRTIDPRILPMNQNVDLFHGDCREVMATMDADSVDAIVTDPPYGLAFMGKGWDHAVPGAEFWAEALRVAKPGAHLVAFGGTRTFHRLACAIEDAGWEVRDTLSWLYGNGFPKSHNLAVAFDKQDGMAARGVGFTTAGYTASATVPGGMHKEHVGKSDLARQWQGWGTALKPAWEPIIMARKPLAGTVAANVALHGTGALNVDGCRIDASAGRPHIASKAEPSLNAFGNGLNGSAFAGSTTLGRWPANVLLDEDAAAMLDEPSRFFYVAKASRSEREAGLDGMPVTLSVHGNKWTENDARENGKPTPRTNHHPTVKPIALMRWLCRLVTPPGGVVLDPFTGSGTTGCAAALEGFRFVGIEREAEYVAIAEHRIAHWAAA